MKTGHLASFMLLSLLSLSPSGADASRSLTLYPDGAQVEQHESAKKGYLEITVPPTTRQDSLRIVPGNGVEILRVVTVPLKPAKSVEKELNQLKEREELLNDRLKALSVREDIFKAAAKSQSAKAPRRTKTNPEPLSSIKQGTDYAITQLESVYHAKRKAEKELSQIAERRATVGNAQQSGGTVAKVWITPASGSVTATWYQSGRSWSPVYQIRFDDKGSALLSLMAQGVTLYRGETAELSLALAQPAGNPSRFRYEGELTPLLKETFTVSNMQGTSSSPYTVNLTNSSAWNLPPGDISCFKSGVYVGKGRFQGADAGKPAEVVCSGK